MNASMTPMGVLAGAVLAADAANTVSREVAHQFLNEPTSEGILADRAMSVAEFMGFSRDVGFGGIQCCNAGGERLQRIWLSRPTGGLAFVSIRATGLLPEGGYHAPAKTGHESRWLGSQCEGGS